MTITQCHTATFVPGLHTHIVLSQPEHLCTLDHPTINVASLISPDALAHVASIFAPAIEDESWLLAGSAPSDQRFYNWIV